MKYKALFKLFCLSFLMINFALTGCMSTALSGANVVYKHKYLQDEMGDYYITVQSWNKLKHEYPHEALQHLHLLSFHKIVLLTGQVHSQELRQQIEHTLQCIPQIARIYNATTVSSSPITTQEQIQDSWISTKVKSKIIASNEIYADKIKVVTEKRIVYLIGIVTQQEADAAVSLAKETEGVVQVVKIFYYMTMPEIN